jgi:hypothetical protein
VVAERFVGESAMRAKASRLFLAILIGLSTALVPGPASAESNVTVTPVASGFSSPRGVALFQGSLLVAEAGTGGSYCDAAHTICIGQTGQISRVNLANGHHTALVANLFSATEFHGGPAEALGPESLSVSDSRVLNVMGVFPQAFGGIHCAANDPVCAQTLAQAQAQAGHLISVGGNGSWRSVASVGSYDYNWTVAAKIPNQELDANPYGVLASEDGAYVADAGSNTLDFVGEEGRVTVKNYFPFRQKAFPADEVPTCVARTDETLWVATLAGHLYRMNNGVATKVVEPDLKHVTGCTTGGDNTLYLVNMWTTDGAPSPASAFTGNVVRFNSDRGSSSVVAGHINFPNMITAGPKGSLYVSADSICPASGIPGLCPLGGSVKKISLGGGDD